jgi:hypothetical protein
MKTCLLFVLIFLSATESYACSCSAETLDEWKPIQNFIKKTYGVTVDIQNDVEWTAYYPGLLERVFAGEMRGSSCEGHGPQNELYLMCQNSRKSDYLVTLRETNCTVKLRVKSNFKRVKVRELHSSCKI